MTRDMDATEIVGEAKVFGRRVLSSLLDGVFVALWVMIQWGVQSIIEKFPLSPGTPGGGRPLRSNGFPGWGLRGWRLRPAGAASAPD